MWDSRAWSGKRGTKVESGETKVLDREFMWRCFLTSHFFKSAGRKEPLKYQTETFLQKPIPFTQEGALWTTNEGKKKLGRGSRWGVMGNFGQGQTIRVVAQETLTSLCSPPTLLCPIKVFSIQTGPISGPEWWLSLLLSGGTVRPITVTARQDLSGTEKERPAIAVLCKMYFWVGMLLFGVGGKSPEDFFLMSVQRVKEGIWRLGLGNGLLGTDSSAPHWVVKASQKLPLLPHICQVHSKSSQIYKSTLDQQKMPYIQCGKQPRPPNMVVCFYLPTQQEKL